MNAQPLQRTPEWFTHRKGRITASRVGAILGVSKYRKPDDVMRDMVREWHDVDSEFTGNEATQWGQDHEADAIAAFEAETGEMVEPAPLVVHPQYDWLAASPDGYVGEHELIECKAPYRAKYTEASEEYRQQMQLQMACTGRYLCHFVVWRPREPVVIKDYSFDAGEFADNMDKLRTFIERFRDIVGSKEKSAVYLDSRERDDDEWRAAANDLRRTREDLARLKQHEADLIECLQSLAPEGAKGCGVTLSRVERAGSIAYAKAIKELAPDADLEAYRGKPSSYYKVTMEAA